MKRSALSRKRGVKRGSKLRVAGKSEVSEIKKNTQSLLREIVIKRDGGCILPAVRHCGGDIGFAVLQADHLISRANRATCADPRLVVCVCRPCHAWKSLGGNLRKAQYDALVRALLPVDRVAGCSCVRILLIELLATLTN